MQYAGSIIYEQQFLLIAFVVLRSIVRTVLQITFTLLRYLFWIIVLAVILLCVL